MLISDDSMTRCCATLRKGAIGAFALTVLVDQAAYAAPTTTAEVGDVADFVMRTATCGDFNEALRKYDKPDQTTKEIILVMLALMYIEGYAAGNGNDSGKRADVVMRCTLNPADRFNTVVPGQ